MKQNRIAILYAVLAAAFYAIQTPLAKLLLVEIPATLMAAFLYLGAGIGVSVMYAFRYPKEEKSERLTKEDFPYTLGMILLDIAAPICMMLGIQYGTASSASLLGNFEIVATALIALLLFREKISLRLWCAIVLITVSGFLLSFEGSDTVCLSSGSLLVILATVCWGLENNCTRRISEKSTYQIVCLKGIFSGLGSLIVSWIIGEHFPTFLYILPALLLGFVAYGLSIFTYIRAQKYIGAAKTSAYYAIAPFLGTMLSILILREEVGMRFWIALAVMLAGGAVAVWDTLKKE